MKICWFGIYNKDYPRNDILMSGLKMNDVELIECHAKWNEKGRYLKLFRELKVLRGDYDLIYCAYPATIPTILAKIVSKRPVVMDAFYSMFDSVVYDRKEIGWYHPRALKLLFFDWLSIMVADYVITDTEEHKKYWSKWLFVNNKKIHTVYLGVNNLIYRPTLEERRGDVFTVHFHGHYTPLQGVLKIVQAAEILKNDPSIHFCLIGSGRDGAKVLDFIRTHNLNNVEQIGRISAIELNMYLNKSDTVLGIFGCTSKAQRVIPNKVYEGIAVKKPVITMDSPAIREIFWGSELMLIKNIPATIAEAIIKLKNNSDLRERLVENAYRIVATKYFPNQIGKDLLKLFSEFLSIQ